MTGRTGWRWWLRLLLLTGSSATSLSGLAEQSPARVFGHLGYEYRYDRFDDGSERMEHSEVLGLGATSYIWQPWFALIDGKADLRLRESTHRRAAPAGDVAAGLAPPPSAEDRSGSFLGGLVTLRLFPFSRFPFKMYYEKRRDEIDDVFLDTDSRLVRYGIDQRYTSGSGLSWHARYEHRTRDFERGEGSERDESDASDLLQLGIGHDLGGVRVDFDSTYGTFDEADGESETTSWFSALRHRYSPDRSFSLDGQITFRELDFERPIGRRVLERFEWSEFALWRPRTERPSWVTAAVRFVDSDTELVEVDLEQHSIAASLGARYEATPHWELGADLTARTVSEQGDERTDSLQRAVARYASSPSRYGGFDHGWFGSMEVGQELEGDRRRADLRYVEARLGHEIGKVLPARAPYPLRLRLYQEVSALADSVGRSVRTLDHDLVVSWNRVGTTAQSFVGATLSDSRSYGGGGEFGEEDSEFQIITLQLSRDQRLERDSTLSGSVSVQAYRRAGLTDGSSEGGEFEPSTSVDIAFDQHRLFGVPRLHFRSLLRYFSTSYRTLLDDADGTTEHAGRIWDNRLRYRIGRLALLLTARSSEIRGREQALIFLQIRRHFDTFH